jgi:SAM-dependent methyltransferase
VPRDANDDDEKRAKMPTGHPPTAQFRLHQALVDHLALDSGDILVDLGCGHGITLAVAAERSTGASLLGLDVDAPSLRTAASWLGSLDAHFQLAVADLSTLLPVGDDAVTKVVCHDLLECLVDPVALMTEASRVLRPGGLSVWSHVDYDSAVVAGGERDLTRRIVHAYADYAQSWLNSNDGQMGRKLAGLVARSPLRATKVDAQVMTNSSLVGPAKMRIDDIAATLRRGAGEGKVEVSPSELDDWTASLGVADAAGDFFYAQTAYVVVARRPER